MIDSPASVPSAPVPTATPSLRRRVTWAVLGLFTVLLLVVGIGIDLGVGAQLNRDLNARLAEGTYRAANLVRAGVAPQLLLAELRQPGTHGAAAPPSGVHEPLPRRPGGVFLPIGVAG